MTNEAELVKRSSYIVEVPSPTIKDCFHSAPSILPFCLLTSKATSPPPSPTATSVPYHHEVYSCRVRPTGIGLHFVERCLCSIRCQQRTGLAAIVRAPDGRRDRNQDVHLHQERRNLCGGPKCTLPCVRSRARACCDSAWIARDPHDVCVASIFCWLALLP